MLCTISRSATRLKGMHSNSFFRGANRFTRVRFRSPPVPRLGWDNCVAVSTLRHESAYTGACPFGRGMGPGKDLGDELVSLAPRNTKIQA